MKCKTYFQNHEQLSFKLVLSFPYFVVRQFPGLEGWLSDGVQEEVDGGVDLVSGHLGRVQHVFAALKQLKQIGNKIKVIFLLAMNHRSVKLDSKNFCLISRI